MKRLIAVIVLALGVAGFSALRAADPGSPLSQTTEGVDTLAKFQISSQLSSDGFQIIDSLIDVCSDTGVFTLMAQGCAILAQNEVLYLGFGNDSASLVSATGNVYSNLDTLTIRAPDNMDGHIYIPFFLYETINTETALTDTFYFNAATGSGTYTIELKDVKFTVDVH